MARKSKQPGGHNPLTAHERKKYAGNGNGSAYGTTTARLGRASQYAFANCGLSLHPAKDRPVASPSGFIYERSAVLEYLLIKTQELKKRREDHEAYLSQKRAGLEKDDEKKRKSEIEDFENSQKVTAAKKQKTETNVLKRTSYWLADMQPDRDKDSGGGGGSSNPHPQKSPPPKRPPSPNTQRPLRRKDLIELELKRSSKSAGGGGGNDGDRGGNDHVLCAVSEKEISTQQALALITKGNDENNPAHVILEEVYKDLRIGEERVPVCPVTGRKIKKVLKLQRGGSAFASSDSRSVEAKVYRPTMT